MTNHLLEKLKKEVFGKQKILAEIYKDHNRESLYNYANAWQTGSSGISNDFTFAAKALLEKYYPNVASDVLNQLRNQMLISTIDHHGILNHPFFINSNLIFSLRRDIKYLICFPTAGVSLNNSSWPGCLIYNNMDGKTEKISFFSDRLKHSPVLAVPPITQETLKQLNVFKNLKEKLFAEPLLDFASFAGQASILSSRFWSIIFPLAPKIIYLPLEETISQLIINVISQDAKHILHKLIFTQTGWQMLNKYFYGLKGAFGDNYGTFLFWQVDKRARRQSIDFRQNDIGFLFQPEKIAKELKKGKLYPGSLVSFLILLFYQMTCLGGFNQVNWLTDIKERFLILLQEMGEREIIEKIAHIPTTNFAEGNLTFMYSNNRLIKPSATDLFLSGEDFYIKYCDLAKQITLGESIESLLPEIYRVITPEINRKKNLMAISDEDILKNNRTDKLIRNILYM